MIISNVKLNVGKSKEMHLEKINSNCAYLITRLRVINKSHSLEVVV